MIGEVVGGVAALSGTLLFVAGTVGLLRFPDVYSRLHAVAKADTLGLGLVGAGVAVYWGDPWVALKLLLIWLLAMASGAILSYLIARAARRDGVRPWVSK